MGWVVTCSLPTAGQHAAKSKAPACPEYSFQLPCRKSSSPHSMNRKVKCETSIRKDKSNSREVNTYLSSDPRPVTLASSLLRVHAQCANRLSRREGAQVAISINPVAVHRPRANRRDDAMITCACKSFFRPTRTDSSV